MNRVATHWQERVELKKEKREGECKRKEGGGRERERSSCIEPEGTSGSDSLRDGHTSGTRNDNLAL